MGKKRMNETNNYKGKKATWTCLICEEENPNDEDICQGCGAYRQEHAYDALADDED